MQRKIVSLITSFVLMITCVFSLTACDKGSNDDKTTRMTVDINPSVEFMLDNEDKVISVTALNDDGSVLIAGEVFVGKSAEEAVELIVSLATDTGYIVKGSATASENQVKISVSGDEKEAEKLYNQVKSKTEKFLNENNVSAKVERAQALTIEKVKELAFETTLLTQAEIEKMTESELYKHIAESREETSVLLTQELLNAYNSAKEYELDFATSEATANVINGMGSVYTVLYQSYKATLDMYSDAIKAVEDFRYDTFISPTGAYQTKLNELREAKAELIKQKNIVASIAINDEEYASASLTLTLKEEQYNDILSSFEALGDNAVSVLDGLIASLKSIKTSLDSVLASMPESVTEELSLKAEEIQESLNVAKDNFFAEFEAEHSDDIEAIKADLIAKKQALKEANENN